MMTDQPFQFADDISPNVNQFVQRKTYLGLLEGVPNTEINNSDIPARVEEVKRIFSVENVLIIQPEQTPIGPKEPLYTGRNGQPVYRARLPSVTCMMDLSSYYVGDPEKEWSRLGLLWYQEEYAFPIDQKVIDEIKRYSWKKLSIDEYF